MDIVKMTKDEWSAYCARQRGQRINGKRFAYIVSDIENGRIYKWREVELTNAK